MQKIIVKIYRSRIKNIILFELCVQIVYNRYEVTEMIENINDFLSIATLSFFLFLMAYGLLQSINRKRVRKHIEEEYYYYQDSEDLDDDE